MIEKLSDFKSVSGVNSPLVPLVYADGVYSSSELDGIFIQSDKNGEISALFSMKNTCVALCGISESDEEELESFFRFCGVRNIVSDTPLSGFSGACGELPLMKFSKRVYKNSNTSVLTAGSELCEYQEVYNIIFNGDGSFENWFPEFSKKINSGVAFASYFKIGNAAVSAAISPYVFGKNAVIAGVSTSEAYRNKGYGGLCVKSLLKTLYENGVSDIFLWCEDDKLPFYEKIGFEKAGKVYLGVLD